PRPHALHVRRDATPPGRRRRLRLLGPGGLLTLTLTPFLALRIARTPSLPHLVRQVVTILGAPPAPNGTSVLVLLHTERRFCARVDCWRSRRSVRLWGGVRSPERALCGGANASALRRRPYGRPVRCATRA